MKHFLLVFITIVSGKENFDRVAPTSIQSEISKSLI